MSRPNLPTRTRIVASNAHKYIGRNVAVIGEVTNLTPHANTMSLRLPDDENCIVLLQKNATTIEPNRLTEVAGKLVSRGQIEATWVNQFSAQETATFNKSLYAEAALVWDAQQQHCDLWYSSNQRFHHLYLCHASMAANRDALDGWKLFQVQFNNWLHLFQAESI